MLPNVFLVGAARSGTNWLCELLRHVPGCRVPSLKEPNYFALVDEEGWEPHGPFSRVRRERLLHTHSKKSIEEYRAMYQRNPDATVRVDGSVRYLWSPLAPGRIAQSVPEARMIVLLRDPTERAWSHYLLNRMLGTEGLGFIDALDAETERARAGWGFDWRYREVSDYDTCLSRWYEHFPKERFLLRSYEDFNADPETVLTDVLEHVGISDAPACAQAAVEFNRNAPRIHPRRTTRLPALASMLWDPAVRQTARKFVPTSIRRMIASGVRSATNSDHRPELDAQDLAAAKSRLADLPYQSVATTPADASVPPPSP